MKVSVVIPAYNEAEYLREAVASALAQTFGDLEILVVDDGSTDATAQVCSAFRDSRLKYIYQANDGTRGIGARNRAMMMATGEWIAPLDQDDRWSPDKLEKQLLCAQQNPNAGVVVCRVRFIDQLGRVTSEQADDLPEGAVFHGVLQRNRYYVASGMFRRSLLSVAGLPDESCGFADWALWAGLTRHAEVAVVHEALADYREHAQSFLGQMSGTGELRKFGEHLKTLNRNALRAHPNCRACRTAIDAARVETAKWTLRVARRTLRAGSWNPAPAALALAWRAAPRWLARPWVLSIESVRLILSAAVGLPRRALRRNLRSGETSSQS